MGKLLTRHDYMDRLDVNFSRHLVPLTEKKEQILEKWLGSF